MIFYNKTTSILSNLHISISLLKTVWEHMIGGLFGSGSYKQGFLFSEYLFTVFSVQSTVDCKSYGDNLILSLSLS